MILQRLKKSVLKMTMCDVMGAERNSYPYFKHFENSLQIAVGGAIWLDITCIDAT